MFRCLGTIGMQGNCTLVEMERSYTAEAGGLSYSQGWRAVGNIELWVTRMSLGPKRILGGWKEDDSGYRSALETEECLR